MYLLKYSLPVLFALLFLAFNLTAKETYQVPMRDGIHLATDVYRPNDNLARPVILVRTPYNKNSDKLSNEYITLLNFKGMVYVVQDCRGRFASEGVDSVFITDGSGPLQDGYDTIDWLANQPWCNGKVGMYGASASGITAYGAVGAAHPNLVCAFVLVAPSDFYHQVVYPGGEFRKSICEKWITGQGSAYMIDFFKNFPNYSPFWDAMNLHSRASVIHTPVYHIGGWYDCFSDGPVAGFRELIRQSQAGPQKLIMGPWTHGTTGSANRVGEMSYPNASFDVIQTLLFWLDYWLLGTQNGILNEPNVKYYLMGDPAKTNEAGCQWLSAETWPPVNVIARSLYLNENGQLISEAPNAAGAKTFSYDPANPVPTRGGNNLVLPAGPYDQRALGTRDDVLEFSTDVLSEPLRVEGFVEAELFVSSNCPDTDFSLKLIDVYPDGREMLVTDGIARARFRSGETAAEMTFLTPGEIVPISIKLPPTAIVFNSGHRLKIAISSSNFERFEVNPNTDQPLYDFSEKRIAENTVHWQPGFASRVILPAIATCLGISGKESVLPGFHLANNYPNPFNATTVITYELPEISEVELSIFNQHGQCVRQLVNTILARGTYQTIWNGQDETGSSVASGVYYCRFQTPNASKTSKLLFLK